MAESTAKALVDRLTVVVSDLPEERIAQILDFAEYLSERDWIAEQRAFSLLNLAKAYADDEPAEYLKGKAWDDDYDKIGPASLGEAYGDDEPEYTLADLKR